jgi:EAL domain-containing protein (putative c-di-GMP-specific phosphodiesterase class I)
VSHGRGDGAPGLGSLGLLELRPVYQPIVDLRDGAVVGYEALLRGPKGSGLAQPEELFAAARAEDRVADLDMAGRDAALRGAEERGLSAPFSLFVNAAADTLADALPERPTASCTLVLEISEKALIAHPEALLRSLSHLRTLGWGVALDDVGADSRSLTLMSLLYPDVIKLDLRLLGGRSEADVARTVTAVGAEAERRYASVLAEGIDSEEQLAAATAFGATLGQGYLLGAPGPLPDALPAGRGLRLTGGGGDPEGANPYERVTNWRRPASGARELAERAAAVVVEQARQGGQTAMVLAALPRPELADADSVARYRALAERLAFVGVLGAGDAFAGTGVRGGPLQRGDPLRESWTVAVLDPSYSACFVAREEPSGAWSFATSFDRDVVLECAVPLMARMEPLSG